LTSTGSRRAFGLAGRGLAAVLVVAATSGRLPHLVLSQAVVSALLTMVAAPLILLHPGAGRRRWTVPAFPAVALMSAGTLASQAPPVVAVIGEGGPLTAVVLVALLVMAVGFWSVVMPPARLRGLGGAAYVVAGSLPISMPAMFLLTVPRDIYASFHALAPSPLAALDDQILAGFILFAAVKVTMFVAFTCLFIAASREKVEDGPDEGGGDRGSTRPPALPGWVRGLLAGAPTVDEPAAPREPAAEPQVAARR
jgi:hypothetical protein